MSRDPYATPAEQAILDEMAAAEAAGGDPLGDRSDDEPAKPDAEGAEVDADAADETKAEEGADDDAGEGATETDPAAEADPKPDAASAEALAEVAAEDEADDLDAPVALPVPKAIDYDAKRAELRKDKKDAKAKLAAGEISDEDFEKFEDRVADELEKLTKAETRAETIATTNQARQADYEARVIASVAAKAKKEDGIDYVVDTKIAAKFDRACDMIAADPDFAGKPFSVIAREAHKAVLALSGKKPAAAAPATAVKDKTPPARVPAKGPLTLRELPAAAASNTTSDLKTQWAALSGPAAERFFEKLSPANQAALLEEKV